MSLPSQDFPGGPLDFIYAHTDEGCRIDAGHLLDTSTLPTAAQAVGLLHDPLLRAQAVRVVLDGESQPVRRLSRKAGFNSKMVDDALDSLTLRRLFAAGATLIIEDVGRWHLPVAMICNTIFNDSWRYANAGYFITRSGNRGLPFHADEETTFVFQLAGSKRWHVANQAAERLGAAEVPPGTRIAEFILRPGDAACIPPMYPHRTQAVDSSDSIHLTIGVRPFKLKDFLLDLAERGMARVPALDEGIDSIETSLDPLLRAGEGEPAAAWQRELAIASIRVASGMVDRGFEFAWPEGTPLDHNRSGPVLGDLVWRVRLDRRSLVHLSGRFAVMDDRWADALCAAVAARNARGCTWRTLAAEGRIPAPVGRFLETAGWDLGDRRAEDSERRGA